MEEEEEEGGRAALHQNIICRAIYPKPTDVPGVPERAGKKPNDGDDDVERE